LLEMSQVKLKVLLQCIPLMDSQKVVKLTIFRRPRKKVAGKAREYRGMKRT